MWETERAWEKICTTKTRGWRRTWVKFSRSAPGTIKWRVFFQCDSLLTGELSKPKKKRGVKSSLKRLKAWGWLEGAWAMEANSRKHRFRKGRSATFSIDGFNITIGKNSADCLHVTAEETHVFKSVKLSRVCCQCSHIVKHITFTSCAQVDTLVHSAQVHAQLLHGNKVLQTKAVCCWRHHEFILLSWQPKCRWTYVSLVSFIWCCSACENSAVKKELWCESMFKIETFECESG